MNQPLTTPSGMNRATPLPRNPDGSPVPAKKAAALRAAERARAAVPESADRAYDAAQANTGPLSPEEAERRLRPTIEEQRAFEAEHRIDVGPEFDRELEAAPHLTPKSALLATPEDEAEVQERYGKSTEELTTEAETGYEVVAAEPVPLSLPDETTQALADETQAVTETEEQAFERELAEEKAAKAITEGTVTGVRAASDEDKALVEANPGAAIVRETTPEAQAAAKAPAKKVANPRQPAKKAAQKP